MRNEFSVGWKIIIFSILVKYFNSEKTICLGSFGEGNDSISFLLFFFFPKKDGFRASNLPFLALTLLLQSFLF